MDEPDQPEHPMESTAEQVALGRLERRHARIREEIRRNRAGDNKVPTWVLAAILGLILLGWLVLVITR